MKYLLDTSAVVNHLRGRESLEASILQRGCAISIITQAVDNNSTDKRED